MKENSIKKPNIFDLIPHMAFINENYNTYI